MGDENSLQKSAQIADSAPCFARHIYMKDEFIKLNLNFWGKISNSKTQSCLG